MGSVKKSIEVSRKIPERLWEEKFEGSCGYALFDEKSGEIVDICLFEDICENKEEVDSLYGINDFGERVAKLENELSSLKLKPFGDKTYPITFGDFEDGKFYFIETRWTLEPQRLRHRMK
ncbi:Uncharacterised protein [Campylobacter hyointestinalis subsp. hyointestinalis]|uniref:Uncharacterized protein n=1 Tax=Campylobacter hyointestinalis subsp. hyointestinalis TaxID=91352 RepID=A0A9W5ETQ8_CAMHY|nr:hypothetical protein [Campylobacter hyointestinalis]CUU77448.1 Uncharacterised protein [Campylobacter hyointestinalis subsp. hyointestinalis]